MLLNGYSVQSVQGCHFSETLRPTSNSDCEGDTTSAPVINCTSGITKGRGEQITDGLTLQMEKMDQPPITALVSKKSAVGEPSDATDWRSEGGAVLLEPTKLLDQALQVKQSLIEVRK